MFQLRNLMLPFVLLTLTSTFASAQESVPLVTTTYRVQVQKEFWRNGNRYWSTVLETSDRDEAELFEALLWIAYDNNEIDEVLNYGWEWIVRDIRIDTSVELNDALGDFRYLRLGESWSLQSR